MSGLSEIIRDEIREQGSIGFDRFMELALYHPSEGYYRASSGRPRTGREGDFFTSVSVGPLFGRLLAKQFFQMWQLLDCPGPFWIIEQGANDGQLACDVLSWCRSEAPTFFETVRYAVIEPSSPMENLQRRRLEQEGLMSSVQWFSEVQALAKTKPVGVFFSNELIDAFPVKVIIRAAQEWREQRVVLGPGAKPSFAWADRPIEEPRLREAVDALPLPAVEGYVTEINLRAREWMADVAQTLNRGYVLTLDYGFPAPVYYAPFRVRGTLTAYYRHRRSEKVLIEPGSRDITAHVDFTALVRAGQKAGLAALGFVDQQRFLMGVAKNELGGGPGPHARLQDNLRAWNTLTHPEHLGARFHVLLQAKEAPPLVDGLQFARPGGWE